MTVTVDQMWTVADQLINADSAEARAAVLAGFDGNTVTLQHFCRAISVNGSREACPAWLVKSLEAKA